MFAGPFHTNQLQDVFHSSPPLYPIIYTLLLAHELCGGQLILCNVLCLQETSRQPAAPFTTSSLQQEASTRLGMGGTRTMSLAQILYEGKAADGASIPGHRVQASKTLCIAFKWRQTDGSKYCSRRK